MTLNANDDFLFIERVKQINKKMANRSNYADRSAQAELLLLWLLSN